MSSSLLSPSPLSYSKRLDYPAANSALYSIVVQMKPKPPPAGASYRPGTVSRTATAGSNRQQVWERSMGFEVWEYRSMGMKVWVKVELLKVDYVTCICYCFVDYFRQQQKRRKRTLVIYHHLSLLTLSLSLSLPLSPSPSLPPSLLSLSLSPSLPSLSLPPSLSLSLSLPPSLSLSLSPLDLDYSDLRAEAAVHAQLRAEAFQKAAKARGEKQGELAMHYAQQVHHMIIT